MRKLGWEIENLRRILFWMGLGNLGADEEVQKNMMEKSRQLEDKDESLETLESHNQTLIVNEPQSCNKLLEAQKELEELKVCHLELPLTYDHMPYNQCLLLHCCMISLF